MTGDEDTEDITYTPLDCAEQLARVTAERDALRTHLRDVLAPIEAHPNDDDLERAALRIRATLGLCQTAGCDGERGSDEADGYCDDCLDDGEPLDALAEPAAADGGSGG